MTTQKEIVFSQLQGKFTQNFDNFGKMDPFLQFFVGKDRQKTQVAESAGKQPVWKKQITLVYYDQTHITVKAYDQDATQDQVIGTGKIQIKGLRLPGGALEVTILSQTGQNLGVITGKYAIKNLPASPLLIVKNIKTDFVKQHSFLLKTQPFIKVSSEESHNSTEHKQDGKGFQFVWPDSLRIRMKQTSKVIIAMYDKNDQTRSIFEYEAHAKQFRRLSGSKKYSVLDSAYHFLGSIQFDYETVAYVNRQEAVKNIEKQKKAQVELNSIQIQSINSNFKKGGRDIYYRIVIGNNLVQTEVLKNSSQQHSVDIKKRIYAESRQSRIMLLVWQSNILKDKIIGVASISLQGLSSGQKNVILIDPETKEEIGSSIVTLTTKQVAAKTILIDNVTVSLSVQGADMIGESQPYLVFRIGGATSRTQSGEKNTNNFRRKLELKYSDEQTMTVEVWDEDVTNDEKLYQETVKLSQLKAKGELNLKRNGKNDKLSFKYEMKEVKVMSPQARKPSQKKLSQSIKVKQVEEKPQAQKVQSGRQKALPKKTERKEEELINQKLGESAPKKTDRKQVGQEVFVGNNSSSEIPKKHTTTQENDVDLNGNYVKNNDVSRNNQTITLPSIIGGAYNNYGDRIFDKQSAATLQRSIHVYSMPKAPRFSNQTKYSGQPSYCMDSCFKPGSNKGVGFGYGSKKQFPDWMTRNMKQNPAPGSYIQNLVDIRSKGPSFGISHKHYEHVMIPKEKRSVNAQARKLSPIREVPK